MSAGAHNRLPPPPAAIPRTVSREVRGTGPNAGQTEAVRFGIEDALGGEVYKTRATEHILPAAGLTGDAREVALRNGATEYDARFLVLGPITTEVFRTAHGINEQQTNIGTNREITDLSRVNAFMPGARDLVHLSHNIIRNNPTPRLSPDEQLFVDAMQKKTDAWKKKLEPQPVRFEDENGDHDPDYYPNQAAYQAAQASAANTLLSGLQDKITAAYAVGNPILADLHRQELREMQQYQRMFVGGGPHENQVAAQSYMVALRANSAPGAGAAEQQQFDDAKTAMMKQAKLDEIYAKCDHLVKAEMRRELDANDARDVATMKTQLETMAGGVSKGYKSKRSLFGAGGRVERVAYDAQIEELVDLEARIEAREHKDTKTEFKEDEFIERKTNGYFGNLGKKTADEHKGAWKGKGFRGVGRAVINKVTGRDAETGAEAKGKTKIIVRVAAGMGVIAVGAATGGLSILPLAVTTFAVDRHLNKDAEANAELAHDGHAGVATHEKTAAAIAAAGTRREKIRAATKANREANEEVAKKVVKKALFRAAATGITVGVSTAVLVSPAEQWIARQVTDVWDAGAGIIENMNDTADGKHRNEIRALAYKYIN